MDQFNNQGQFNQGAPYQQQPPEPAQIPNDTNVQAFDFKGTRKITLDSGITVDMPRLTTRKVIELGKFLAKDGVGLYNKIRTFNYNQYQAAVASGEHPEGEPFNVSMDDLTSMIIEELSDEQIVKIISILTGLEEEQALEMDFVDTLEIVEKFTEITNLQKAFTSVRKMTERFSKAFPVKHQPWNQQ